MTQQVSAEYKFILQAVAGGITGAVTKTSVAPLERVKILLQVQGMSSKLQTNPKYTSIFGSFPTLVKEEGFMALYKGNGANVLRIVPNYALKFSLNDFFRDFVAKPNQPLIEFTFWQLLTAGTLSGLCTISAVYPLDVLRTRMALSEALTQQVHYRGLWHCCKHIVQTEGFSALYKGIGTTWFVGIPNVAFQMTFYDVFKRMIPKETMANYEFMSKFLCGALAGLVAQTIVFPGDTIRKRMQTNGIGGNARLYSTSFDCFKKILVQEGVRGFFRGSMANVARTIPGAAIQFSCYDFCKVHLGLTPKE